MPAKGGLYEKTDEVGLAQEAAEQGHFRNHEHLQKVIYKWRGQWYTRTR